MNKWFISLFMLFITAVNASTEVASKVVHIAHPLVRVHDHDMDLSLSLDVENLGHDPHSVVAVYSLFTKSDNNARRDRDAAHQLPDFTIVANGTIEHKSTHLNIDVHGFSKKPNLGSVIPLTIIFNDGSETTVMAKVTHKNG